MNEAPREFTDAARAMIPIIEALKEDGWNSRAEMAARVQEHIQYLESQLAARNQAAEAMGVLERLVVGIDHETKSWVTLVQCEDGKYELRLYKMTDFINGSPAPSITNANSLIETVLKAGGEG